MQPLWGPKQNQKKEPCEQTHEFYLCVSPGQTIYQTGNTIGRAAIVITYTVYVHLFAIIISKRRNNELEM